jgi:uncharacterized membrane protein YdbT with pleckstrin-like domain
MTYVHKYPQLNESAEYHSTIHWVIYLPAMLVMFGCAGVISVTVKQNSPDISWLMTLGLGLLNLGFVWGNLNFLSTCFTDWSTEIAVTDRWIILTRGFIRRRTVGINLNSVKNVDVRQSVLGRILN